MIAKNNKGVSLVVLVITIAVMVIIIAITLNSSIISIQETNKTRIDNEIRDLKDAVDIRMTNYERNSASYPIIGEKIGDNLFEYIRTIENKSSSELSQIISKISSTYSEETESFYRLIGRNEAEKLGVENIDIDHYYVVDYLEKEVYGPVSISN